MDKKTILAVVLCTIVIIFSFTFQSMRQADAAAMAAAEANEVAAAEKRAEETKTEEVQSVDWNKQLASTALVTSTQPFNFETDYFDITFDPNGASVSSIKLKKYTDNGKVVDMLFRTPLDNNAFLLYLGKDTTEPITAPFSYKVVGNSVIFTQNFTDPGTNNAFTITKTFEFKQSDYMFKVSVDITSEKPLSFDSAVYTLGFEPQIGPSFNQMKNDNYNYRRFYINSITSKGKDKKLQARLTDGSIYYEDSFSWVDITGKYFSSVAMPADRNHNFIFQAKENTDGGIALTSNYYLTRRADDSTNYSDSIYFYCGPQLKEYLGSYYNRDSNAWGLSGLNLDKVMDGGSIFSWLENILKWMLNMLYKLIPNYGIAIILVTVLLKIVLYPLTRKSMESTAKMSALGPKTEELKIRYKDNPEKLNQATMELYKEEGISPLGGCLPMLLQFPILIAFYGLLNKHFELRGAMFIPGWIPDLSIPDTVAVLGFNIPLLGKEIHLLPILYTISMIFTSKITTAGQSNTTQTGSMKLMTYGMPIIFFFILYSAPSGLLLYWSAQNVISVVQQLYMNKRRKYLEAHPELVKRTKKEQKKYDMQKQAELPAAIRKFEEKKKRLEEMNKKK